MPFYDVKGALDSKGCFCFESNHAFNLSGFQKRFSELYSEFEILHFGIEVTTEQWASIYESLL